MINNMIQFLQQWIKSDRSVIIKNTLRVIGAYGIIQVFAQDVGISSGKLQAEIIRNVYMQVIIFTSVAYSVTDDFFQSLSGTLIYFILKYLISKGKLEKFNNDNLILHHNKKTPVLI